MIAFRTKELFEYSHLEVIGVDQQQELNHVFSVELKGYPLCFQIGCIWHPNFHNIYDLEFRACVGGKLSNLCVILWGFTGEIHPLLVNKTCIRLWIL